MSQIRPLIPLLITAGILIGGNGLQGTYISLRALQEGFSTSLIGLVGTGYNIGFAIGCIYVTRILRSIGHIRTFSAMAAIASAASIAMVLLDRSVVLVPDAAGCRHLFRQPVRHRRKLAQRAGDEFQPRPHAVDLPSGRSRLGHRRAISDPDRRHRRLPAFCHRLDGADFVAGADFLCRPFEPGRAGSDQVRHQGAMEHLAARDDRLHRGRA